jgi:hypothetical protein
LTWIKYFNKKPKDLNRFAAHGGLAMSDRQWLLMVFWMLVAKPANAQYAGAIKGQVVDPQGALVAGATLTLTGSELPGRRTSVSNGVGNYIFLGLSPGVYLLEVTRAGFHRKPSTGFRTALSVR